MAELDPDKRYLYARLRGGFTDQMVQLEKCRLYAVEFGRVLIADPSPTGLREPLSRLFDPSPDFGCELEDWSVEWNAALDGCDDVHPHELRGRISEVRAVHDRTLKCAVDAESGTPILFDFGMDHPAQLMIYDQAGGGSAAFHVLARLQLKPDIATDLARRILDLGQDYDAVHIRHTDYQTDHRRFLTKLRPLLKSRRVLICTDNADVQKSAAALLDPSTTVLGLSAIPDIGDAPLHLSELPDLHAANVAMIGDLLALALSRRLVFTHLSGGNANGVQISGFSMLAAALWRNKQVAWSLLDQADPAVLEALRQRRLERLTVMRRLRELDLWRWNFVASNRAWRRNRRIATKSQRAADIGPKFSRVQARAAQARQT